MREMSVTEQRDKAVLKIAGCTYRAVDNAKLGGMERSYAADNARELERLRALVSKLSDQDLGSMVNEYWTVAGVLGHMAFWDGRALFLARKLEREGAFTHPIPSRRAWTGSTIPPARSSTPSLRARRPRSPCASPRRRTSSSRLCPPSSLRRSTTTAH